MSNKVRRGIARLAASLLGLMLAGPVLAQSTEGPPETAKEADSRADSCNLLKQGQYTDLDKKMNDLQNDYEAGKITDVNLLHVFRYFCADNHSLESKYKDWVSNYPNSYAARLANGIYLREMTYYWRGGAFIDQLSPTQIENMRAYVGRAVVELKLSLALASRPLLSYHALLGVSALNGDYSLQQEAIDAADRMDPRNFVVRYKYIATNLTTRWGGSLQQMIDFREESQRAGLSDPQLGYFDDVIRAERYWLANCQCRAGSR